MDKTREVALTKCTHCGRVVTLFQDSSWMCASCGHGTFRQVPDNKIRWLRADEAELAIILSGNASRIRADPLEGILTRKISS